MAIPATPSKRRAVGSAAKMGSQDYLIVAGSFETNDTAEVTNVKGEGFKVTRSGVGVFDITVECAVGLGLISAVASVQADTANTLDDLAAQVGTYTKSTGVLEIFTRDALVTTDAASPHALTDGNGPRVNFVAVFHYLDSRDTTYTA